ncbi:unnamed protein product [Peronospora belbahrii]|uniref:t-SNARE coiled-coil homology domain-containing protein n=1 Tax=Peronospora belbahrii TaxID=622444 RepID=A0AAU9LGJ1_9STRA|nr:unnamed protein product [Peronospora belbahrii]CAH0522413.1 unnamed protein product [Peronospora belbahrii]
MRVDVTSHFRELAPVYPSTVPKKLSVISIEAMDLLSNILELETLLYRIKPQYLLPKRFIRIKGSRMSEDEKDELDTDLMELIKKCSSRITILMSMEDAQPVISSVQEHQKEVVAYLLERLNCVADSAKQMQKRRYKQPFIVSPRLLPEHERQELDILEQKLAHMNKERAVMKEASATSLTKAEASVLLSPKSTDSTTSASRANSVSPLAASPAKHRKESRRSASKAQDLVRTTQQQGLVLPKNEKLEFTKEENRRFRAENVLLHRHFQENLEDAKKMEFKMTEISNLMGQFADKIMEQQTDIELIQHHAQETKSNVSQSNRILEQTQKVGKGYGFIIFCFYVGFSIILHIMHYFNS